MKMLIKRNKLSSILVIIENGLACGSFSLRRLIIPTAIIIPAVVLIVLVIAIVPTVMPVIVVILVTIILLRRGRFEIIISKGD